MEFFGYKPPPLTRMVELTHMVARTSAVTRFPQLEAGCVACTFDINLVCRLRFERLSEYVRVTVVRLASQISFTLVLSAGKYAGLCNCRTVANAIRLFD